MPGWDSAKSLDAVPLFPLPNVVLFPRAVLPLHIFEERYKQMTADVLAGDRLVAMALLQPGWEMNYYQQPDIDPVVCVGEILAHEKLPDGTYNFLLQGQIRARIVREWCDRTYRVAELTPIAETPVLELDLEEQRQRMRELFDGPLGHLSSGQQFRQFLSSPLSCADLADLLAYSFLEDVQLKQSLLAEGDVRRRVDRVLDALDAIGRQLHSPLRGFPTDPSIN